MSSLKDETKELSYIRVSDDEQEEPMELPLETDGTLLLSTLTAQFPGSSGLKFRSAKNTMRGIRLSDGRLHAPEPSGWPNLVYFCVFPKENKRKSEDLLEAAVTKTKKIEVAKKCTDLVLLNIPYQTTEEDLRDYFEQFGETKMLQLKKDPNTQLSRGYAFVRFASYAVQKEVLARKHTIGGRSCELKVPNSREFSSLPCKVFIGRLNEDITCADLEEYFGRFGTVTEVYIPKPFRSFAFVTFDDSEVVKEVFGKNHFIKGVSIFVSSAAPKKDFSGAAAAAAASDNNNVNFNFINNQPSYPRYWDSQTYSQGGGARSPKRHNYSNNRHSFYNSDGHSHKKRTMEMPNLQSLGINGGCGSANSAAVTAHPTGTNCHQTNDFASNPFQISPTLLAAALNQVVNWNLLSSATKMTTTSPPPPPPPIMQPQPLMDPQTNNYSMGPKNKFRPNSYKRYD